MKTLQESITGRKRNLGGIGRISNPTASDLVPGNIITIQDKRSGSEESYLIVDMNTFKNLEPDVSQLKSFRKRTLMGVNVGIHDDGTTYLRFMDLELFIPKFPSWYSPAMGSYMITDIYETHVNTSYLSNEYELADFMIKCGFEPYRD